MAKRFVVLLLVLLFAVGAAGGCLNQTPPNLSGTWNGKMSRASNPTIRDFADVTMELTQDQNNHFSGTVTVKYNPNTSNEVTLNAIIVPNESSTNEWGATVKANGVNNTGSDIIVSNGNFSFRIPAGSTYTFTFAFLYLYACRGENINGLDWGYILTTGNDPNPIDSGLANLVKQ